MTENDALRDTHIDNYRGLKEKVLTDINLSANVGSEDPRRVAVGAPRGPRKNKSDLPDTRGPMDAQLRAASPLARSRARPTTAHRGNKKQTVASDWPAAARRGLPLVGTIVHAVACSLDHEVKGLTRS